MHSIFVELSSSSRPAATSSSLTHQVHHSQNHLQQLSLRLSYRPQHHHELRPEVVTQPGHSPGFRAVLPPEYAGQSEPKPHKGYEPMLTRRQRFLHEYRFVQIWGIDFSASVSDSTNFLISKRCGTTRKENIPEGPVIVETVFMEPDVRKSLERSIFRPRTWKCVIKFPTAGAPGASSTIRAHRSRNPALRRRPEPVPPGLRTRHPAR